MGKSRPGYHQDYYQEHKADLRTRTKRRKEERRDWLNSLKVERGCVSCGYRDHPAALHWHHLSNKKTDVARMKNYSQKNILAEINKCVVLCANCHAAKTWKR